MPPYKKKYQKRFKKKRTFRRKTGSKASKDSISVPRNLTQGFPDRYKCTLKTSMVTGLSGAVGHTVSIKGNGLINIGPNTNIGGFSANYPACVDYLLSSAGSPANAPYAKYRITSSKIVVRYVPRQDVATYGADQDIRFCIQPSITNATAALLTLGSNVMFEQPHTTNYIVPTTITTAPKSITRTMTSGKITGRRYRASIEDLSFSGSYNADPVSLWYWNFYFFGNGTDNIVGMWYCDIFHNVEFFDRNIVSSSAPA